MTMSVDGAMILFQRPVSAGLVAASLLLLVLMVIRQFKTKRGDS
jgi:TctA family transporter